jgi:hypothetical protein
MTLNQKQLKKIMDVSAIAGRYDELNRLEGYVPSATISRRKSILKRQLVELLSEDKKEEKTVNIRIEIPEEKTEPKEKKSSLSFNLSSLLAGKYNEVVEDNDEILVALRSLLPEDNRMSIGKIVKEL